MDRSKKYAIFLFSCIAIYECTSYSTKDIAIRTSTADDPDFFIVGNGTVFYTKGVCGESTRVHICTPASLKKNCFVDAKDVPFYAKPSCGVLTEACECINWGVDHIWSSLGSVEAVRWSPACIELKVFKSTNISLLAYPSIEYPMPTLEVFNKFGRNTDITKLEKMCETMNTDLYVKRRAQTCSFIMFLSIICS